MTSGQVSNDGFPRSLKIAFTLSASVSRARGLAPPVSISIRITPADHMSIGGPLERPNGAERNKKRTEEKRREEKV